MMNDETIIQIEATPGEVAEAFLNLLLKLENRAHTEPPAGDDVNIVF